MTEGGNVNHGLKGTIHECISDSLDDSLLCFIFVNLFKW